MKVSMGEYGHIVVGAGSAGRVLVNVSRPIHETASFCSRPDVATIVTGFISQSATLLHLKPPDRLVLQDRRRGGFERPRPLLSTKRKRTAVRKSYEEISTRKAGVDRYTQMVLRRDQLRVRKSQLQNKPKVVKTEKLAVGIDGTIAFDFGELIPEILVAWGFPDGDKAQFDLESQGLTIAGKPRAASGKGVLAILHAAFNVALLLFCRRNELPHPGFRVLDTPCSPIENLSRADTVSGLKTRRSW